MTITTDSTYIAAYYLIHGAKIESVAKREATRKKDKKCGMYWKWSVTLSGIHQKHIDNINNKTAQVRLDELIYVRSKLKEKMKKFLEEEEEKSWVFKERRMSK